MSTTDARGADSLRPSRLQSLKVSAYSQFTWNALIASGHCATKLPDQCMQIRTLLNRTPSVPPAAEVPDSVEGSVLVLQGYSKWSVSPVSRPMNSECELDATKTSCPRSACIGVLQPITCVLSDEYVPQWPSFQSLPRSSGNHLALLVLGWSYVFSAQLVELRRTTSVDEVVYTDNVVRWFTGDDSVSNEHCSLQLGDLPPAELRWWAAILADGRGWRATLSRDGKKYHPPWECHLAHSPFMLHSEVDSSSLILQNLKPPSSAEAQAYLSNFARSRDCFDQLLAAFAAALTLPSHVRFGAPIVLPRPAQGTVPPCSNPEPEADHACNESPTPNELPHFMAFSCIPYIVSSSLSGCFWEPGIPCNLASEWLNPPLKDLLPSLLQQKRYDIILCTLAHRRPMLASLWLAATISGLLPRILQVCRSYLPPTSLEASVWTRSPHSFMDPEYHRRVVVTRASKGVETISREDELRLLYLTDTDSKVYASPPLSPYPPFGRVRLEDTSVEVRMHARCGHEMRYVAWVWAQPSGKGLSDHGVCARPEGPESFPSETKWTPGTPASIWSFLSGAWATACLSRGVAAASSMVYALGCVVSAVTRGVLPWCEVQAASDDRLSESATRHIFCWTFFLDGTRLGDRELWGHEWLSFLLDRDDDQSTSSSSSSLSQEVHKLAYGRVEEWVERIQPSTQIGDHAVLELGPLAEAVNA